MIMTFMLCSTGE